MPLNPDCVGSKTQCHRLQYDWKTLALYALGIGATREELDYLYEKRGPKLYPSFAVVPAYPVLSDLIEISQGPYEMVVHSGQSIKQLQTLPPSGVLETVGEITAMYDLKRMAQLVFTTRTTVEGEPVFETQWEIIFRGEGGFGGPRRPKPNLPIVPDRAADWEHKEVVPAQQALLYRLSGDTNPLHADPEFAAEVGFEQGPILHGLCTFGYLCRAVSLRATGGNAARIRSLCAQFKKPVWPGEELRTEGFVEGDQVILRSFAGGRPDAVVSGAAAEITLD